MSLTGKVLTGKNRCTPQTKCHNFSSNSAGVKQEVSEQPKESAL